MKLLSCSQISVVTAHRAFISLLCLQVGAQPLEQQHAELPCMPTSVSSDMWLPPMPADFGTGLLDRPSEGLHAVPHCEAAPMSSIAAQQVPGGDQLPPAEPAAPAALDLGSLLGPIGDSWMGPLAFSAPAEGAPAAATSGTQVVATQKPFHMLFPIMN